MLPSVRLRLQISRVQPDPIYEHTTNLWRHGRASSASNSNLLQDQSPQRVDSTPVNQAQVDRTNLVARCREALLFDGANDAFPEGASTKQIFGANDFTIECYLWVSSYQATHSVIGATYAGAGARSLRMLVFNGGALHATYTTNGSSDAGSVNGGTVPLSTWVYVTLDRWEQATWAFSLDGVFSTPAANSATIAGITNAWNWGRQEEGTWFLNGRVAMPRITIGRSRYRGQPFNPPRKPHWYPSIR